MSEEQKALLKMVLQVIQEAQIDIKDALEQSQLTKEPCFKECLDRIDIMISEIERRFHNE